MIPSLPDLKRDFGLTPVVATEIEFYLHGIEPDDNFREGLLVEKFEQEKGRDQWEVALPMSDAERAVENLLAVKSQLAARGADFTAKPFASEPGSGLHVHVHLEDASGHKMFFKKDEEISDTLKWSIGGLLATVHEHMAVFAPTAESRARFVAGSNAPITASWGANNRTCAIRLPDAGAPWRHIEHRVAGADAEPGAVIAAILKGIHHGLAHKCEPGLQIYGDAALAQYNLPRLCS